MKNEQISEVYYRGNEFVMVQKAQEEFGPGSVVCVDANEDGEFELESVVGNDGIWSITFELAPSRTNKEGQFFTEISTFMRAADSSQKSEPTSFRAIQEATDNPAKAIPENCAVDVSDNPNPGMERTLDTPICTCTSCADGGTLLGSSLEGFSGSFTPTEYGVETATGKYRNAYHITSFDTQMLGFNLNLHYASMVKYPGPVGEGFSHSYNGMIIQNDELTGQIVTPDLHIFDINSEDGINWHLPSGFYSRLCLEPETNRWILTHYSGLEVAFYKAIPGCPGYPISIREPNGNTACMTYSPSGYLQNVTTDLDQNLTFQYDSNGLLASFSDHIGRTWEFPHDAEGRLSGIQTPVTTYANIPAGREITDKDLDNVLVAQERCWTFGYRNDQFPNHITSETDPRGATYRENVFDETGRVIIAHINGKDVQIAYDSVALPLGIQQLEEGNRIRSITDREGNITYYEIHGLQGGPKNNTGQFGLRRSITLTERGKGNAPLRDDEPDYWEQRWLHDCSCLVPIVVTQPFSSNDIPGIQFDEFSIPTNSPREIFTFNKLQQKTSWTYTDGTKSIMKQWTYQRDAYGDNQQFSRRLTKTDPREFDENPIYAGLNFIHTHEYDTVGNHTQHDAPTVTLGTTIPQKIRAQWTYNSFGQPVSYSDPNGNITTYAYFSGSSSGGDINTKGRFGGYLKSMTRGAEGSTDPATNLKQKFKVNALGMTTRLTDEKGFKYETKYNNLQEVVSELEPSVTLINGNRVQYVTRNVRDGAGNIVMTRRNNIAVDGTIPVNAWIDRSASFDVVNNQLSERVEIDANNENDLVTCFAYNNNDDLIVTQRAKGNRTITIPDERRLPLKTFYGVAAAQADLGQQRSNGASIEGYPRNKRATTLDNTLFVGLSINIYDPRQNMVRERDGRGNDSFHFFDFYNRQVAYSDQNGNGWVQDFDDASNVLTESRGAVSQSTGGITELLERTYTRFDEVGRPYQEVRDIDLSSDECTLINPNDSKNSNYLIFFDPGSRVIDSQDANNNSTTMDYDAANRILTTTDALGNQQRNAYDVNSNIVSITESELPGPGATGVAESYITVMAYDELNRLMEQRHLGLDGNSINHLWRFGFDSRSNQCLEQDTESNFAFSTFDDNDRKIMMQRFDGNPLSGSPTELLHYEWAYDLNSNVNEERALSDVNNPNSIQITQHAFDDLDRHIRTVYPDSDDPIDEITNGADGVYDRIEKVYDQNSNLIGLTDQRGLVFTTSFDPGNRPTDQKVTLTDDVPGTDRQSFTYDSLNRTINAKNNYANINKMFDAFSRLITETQSISLDGKGFENDYEQPIQVTHSYDKESNKISDQVLDDNNIDLDISTTFDALNRTDDISAAYFKTSKHTIARYAYIGPGRVQQKLLGNGATLTCTFDSKRRLRTHLWNGSNRLLAGFEYDYDRMDNASFERFNHDQGLCDHFQHNKRYEVIGASYRMSSSVPPTTPTNTYDYDDVFNRRQAKFGNPFDRKATTTDGYAINNANEYTQLIRNGNVNTPTHDRAGNTTSFLVRPVTNNPNQQDMKANARWDAYNLLFAIKPGDVNPQQDYRYDPFRRRIATMELNDSEIREGARRYIYDGWSVVEERVFDQVAALDTAPSTLERIYVNGMQIDEPLLTAIDRNQDGELGEDNDKNVRGVNADQEYYFLNNRLGSIMALLDADNPDRVLECYRYTIYGEPTVLPVVNDDSNPLEDTPIDLSDNFSRKSHRASEEFGNVYLFTARRFDSHTGLYFFRNRYFETTQGRFLSRDPLGYKDSMNLYSYVNNNPSSWSDPFGLDPEITSVEKLKAELQKQLDEAISDKKNVVDAQTKELQRLKREMTTLKRKTCPDKNAISTLQKAINKATAKRNNAQTVVDGIRAMANRAYKMGKAINLDTIVKSKAFRKVGKVAKFGRKIPGIGIVIFLVFLPVEAEAKGLEGALVDGGLDAIPIVGWIKGGGELIFGPLIPDKKPLIPQPLEDRFCFDPTKVKSCISGKTSTVPRPNDILAP